jgi:heme-degrading monooxygenase HmoA
MYSVAFMWEPGTYDTEFETLDAIIESIAVSIPGYKGVDLWRSDDGKRRNTTYYWDNLESLKILSNHPTHLEAKRRYAQWYNGYHVVISQVIRSYGDQSFPHITAVALENGDMKTRSA